MDYKDKSISVENRVDDLLSRMTLKEKVGQLNQKMFGWNAYKKTDEGFELTDEFKEQVALSDGMGALYGLFRSDPWSGVTYENGIPLEQNAKVANQIQRYVIENTRLGIPVLFSEECPHGHQALDGTMLPTNIGAGSTWNPDLLEEAYGHVAKEVRARGGHLGLISTLDILREPRWGRSEECFSEDPYLASQMTVAAVRGLQGRSHDDLKGPDKVAAILKHFAAQGSGEGGLNAGPASIGERELREIHLPGMKAGVSAGAAGCMAAYNEIDGIPCHANSKLLTDILRGEWGFDGIVMADGGAIDRLLMQVGDHESAASLALFAGVDLSLWDTAFTTLEKAVEEGKVEESFIDRAVRRVLNLKFSLGLFDQPFTDENKYLDSVGSKEFQKINLQVARESAVLLKNDGNMLPLSNQLKKVAVIGPNADSIYNQLGDYTAIQPEGKGMSVLAGIKKAASNETEILYAKGCGIRDQTEAGFDEAIAYAKQSDVAIVVLGGSSTRNFDIDFDTNGAAIVSDIPTEMDCGEGVDLADLQLGGKQVELLKKVAATGTKVVTVIIQGRPHAIPEVMEHSNAVLCGWYPGQEGGQAIAELLYGLANPSGKLSVSLPHTSAQLPVFYNHKDQGRELSYTDMKANPLYPFGYGLSYTKFDYSNLHLVESELSIEDLKKGKKAEVKVTVTNTGSVAGAEVAQLYIRDMESSIVRRILELKGFQKVWLEPDESKTISFQLGSDELAVWNSNMEFEVERGNVKIFVGTNSIKNKHIMLKLI
ncbi:glycoside hydrolase family 3 N-terminal domain-containing protein [Gracilibacillus alcaliphilus]|uniref:glycoside hydrolase family 3 N-terminal domain-containing protein n=1 Tax=Gracilibacillus alcaliphilus TaxID=1401441 RepID=UPI00195B8FD8|nr:glycoside hydrolase family 3 N-terminal domain-containing protein [Gracilibacillus alcaliphilus]MBM7678721.1 beta-glucosidase [Gracilibacillus alcaliphilus]